MNPLPLMGIIIRIMEKNMETTIQYVGVTWGLYTDNGTILGILIISRPSKEGGSINHGST